MLLFSMCFFSDRPQYWLRLLHYKELSGSDCIANLFWGAVIFLFCSEKQNCYRQLHYLLFKFCLLLEHCICIELCNSRFYSSNCRIINMNDEFLFIMNNVVYACIILNNRSLGIAYYHLNLLFTCICKFQKINVKVGQEA